MIKPSCTQCQTKCMYRNLILMRKTVADFSCSIVWSCRREIGEYGEGYQKKSKQMQNCIFEGRNMFMENDHSIMSEYIKKF